MTQEMTAEEAAATLMEALIVSIADFDADDMFPLRRLLTDIAQHWNLPIPPELAYVEEEVPVADLRNTLREALEDLAWGETV